ncbi:MAG: ABC transporter permease [Canibacter sp.]
MTSSSNTLTSADRAAAPQVTSPAPGLPRAVGLGAVRMSLWAALTFLVLLPIAAIVWIAATGGGWAEIFTTDVFDAALNSVVSATISAALAVTVGTLLVVLLERTDIRGAHWLRLLAFSPMLMPPFVGAIAWLSLLGPSSALNQFWESHFGSPLWNLYGADGVIFLLTVHSVPIAMIIIGQALKRIPADLEQSARISGSSAPGTLIRITVPLLRPALLASFTLITVSNLADFGIPALIGLPERYTTLSTLVYRYLQSGTVDDPLAVVAAIGFVLLVIALLGVMVDIARKKTAVELDTQSARAEPVPLGRLRTPISILTALAVIAATLLPLMTLSMQALLPAPGVPFTLENITLDSFTRALTASGTVSGVLNSVMLASLAAVVCGILGLAIGTLVTRTKVRSNQLLYGISLLPQAIPGLVIAVAWLVLAPHIGLYNTPWIILLAYITSFVALVVQAVVAPLQATPATAEEAARVSGASGLRALWDVSCRLATPAAVSGAVLVALTAVRELTLSVLLLSPGSQTLGVVIFNLQQAGAYNASSALSVIVALVGLLSLGLTVRGAGRS